MRPLIVALWMVLVLLLSSTGPASAAVTEVALPAEAKKPLAVAFDAAGSLWVTLDGSWAVARFSTGTGKFDLARITVPKAEEEDSLAALAIAPDGGVWTASEAYLHHVPPGKQAPGNLTTANLTSSNLTVESFRLPKPTRLAGGVYVAPDGGIWVSGVTTDELLRFDPATGNFTEHAAPTTPFGPLHIRQGPDGAYVTATYAHTYARFDPATGSITVGTPGILAAPVGLDVKGTTLWAGEMGGSQVGRVDLASGTAEHFPTSPSPYYEVSGPSGIRIARDGSIWFIQHFADKVARLDPVQRTLTEWEVPSAPGTNMQDLAEAPDGSFWFAEWSTNKLGHATWDGAQPSFEAPSSVQVVTGQTLRVPFSAPGAVVVGGYGNLTARWDGGSVVLDASKATPGTYNVLVASLEGKTTLGRYVAVQVQTAKGAPGLTEGLGMALVALTAFARRRA